MLLRKTHNLNSAGSFHIGLFKILVCKHNIPPLLILVALHDIFKSHFFAIHLGNPHILDGRKICFAQQIKMEIFLLRS